MARPPRRQCAATPGCQNCMTSSNGGICPECAFESYFPTKNEQDIVLSNYNDNFFKDLFKNVPRSDWEQALGCIMYEGRVRSKDRVRGCAGIIQDLKRKRDQQAEQLNALYRLKAIREADLSTGGFVRFYEEQNILLQDVSSCTDDQHWYHMYDNLFS